MSKGKPRAKGKNFKLIAIIASIVAVVACIGAVWWFVFYNGGKYEFSYELDGKTVSIKASDYNRLKDKLPSNPQKTDYVFAGWYFDTEFELPVTVDTFNLKANEKEVVKLYPQWVSVSQLNSEGVIPQVTYKLNESGDGMIITGLLIKSVTDLEIPVMINGYPVLSIKFEAFKNTYIQSVTFPITLQTMGTNAFENCVGLRTVTFGNDSQLTMINSGMFKNCEKLSSITIPSSVTTIGSKAFWGCASLSSVTFSENSQLTTINGKVFTGCTSLTSIAIPESVKSMMYTFEDCPGLVSVSLPSSLTTITLAFRGCSNLKNVTFAEGIHLTDLSGDDFANCTSLTNIVIPDGVIKLGAFRGCASLTSITIPSSVTTIADSCFQGCTSLREVIFSENSQLKTIERSAFEDCVALESVTLPDGLETIEFNAFSGCTGLTNATFNVNSQLSILDSNVFEGCTNLTNITIPKSVISICEHTFLECSSLANITYLGTKDEWNAIEKELYWDLSTGNYKVHCMADNTIISKGH